MPHTSETTSNMTTLIQRFATLQVAVSMTQEELEDQIHAEVWRSDWDEVLRLLGLTKGVVSRDAARECILLAVQKAPVEVVRTMLELLPAGEYTGCDAYMVDWSPTGEICRHLKWEVNVQGTMVMHAVAKNRPDVLEVLLNHGFDVNCASAAAAAGLLQDCKEYVTSYGRPFIPYHAYTARPENCVKLLAWDTTPDDIPPMQWKGATPLALAVLLGHVECARILVERGAWLEEAPSVSSAMYLFWREKDPDYQAARAEVLAAGDHARHRPVLWAVGQTCSPQQLKRVLDAWPYKRKELVQAAAAMTRALSYQRELWKTSTDGWQDLCQRMYRIGKHCPEALQAREVIGSFLDYFLRWQGVSIEPLLPFLEGAVLDISEMEGGGLYYLDRPGSRKFFTELAERCQLVMERDAVPSGISDSILRLILKHVRFLPPVTDRGVSALTKRILITGDLRLIRSALKNGLIPSEETTEELLRCQQALKLPPICRSALLTIPRKKAEPKTICPRATDLHERWLAEIHPDDTMPILDDEDWKKWLLPTLRRPYGVRTVRALGEEWQMHKTFFAACLEGREDIVEAMLPRMYPEELRNTESMLCSEKNLYITTTPLCAAALAGQTKIVEMLLNNGAPLQEELWGNPSSWIDHWSMEVKENILPLNPVLAAALGGHWDTVEYLLGCGAVCRWSAPEVQHIWKQLHTEELEETVRKNLRGGQRDELSK